MRAIMRSSSRRCSSSSRFHNSVSRSLAARSACRRCRRSRRYMTFDQASRRYHRRGHRRRLRLFHDMLHFPRFRPHRQRAEDTTAATATHDTLELPDDLRDVAIHSDFPARRTHRTASTVDVESRRPERRSVELHEQTPARRRRRSSRRTRASTPDGFTDAKLRRLTSCRCSVARDQVVRAIDARL